MRSMIVALHGLELRAVADSAAKSLPKHPAPIIVICTTRIPEVNSSHAEGGWTVDTVYWNS